MSLPSTVFLSLRTDFRALKPALNSGFKSILKCFMTELVYSMLFIMDRGAKCSLEIM